MADLVEEKQHARLSPSAAKRWMTCPGSIGFEEKLNIVDVPSKYAAEGTVAHEVHELCLVKGHQAEDYFGKTIESDGFKFKVNQDMVDAVQLSLDYLHDRIEMAELEGLRVEVLVEVRASLKYLGIPGLDGGTSDVVLLFWDLDSNNNPLLVGVEVFDYKHGAGVAVEAIDNPQAMCYGLGVCAKYNAAAEVPIKITISQPRAHHPDGRIRSWDITAHDLMYWQDEELVPKAKATLEPDAKFVPSDDGCRFCRCAGQCPKLYERTQEVAMIDFADEPELPDVETLTSEQKLFIMDHASMLRSFIVAVEKQVKHEVDHGSQDYENSYKLVRKTTHRKLDEDALEEGSELLDYLTEDDLFERKSRSLTEIEQRLIKAAGKVEALDIMDWLTTKPTGDLVIAPISDKRLAQSPALISDFKNLDD